MPPVRQRAAAVDSLPPPPQIHPRRACVAEIDQPWFMSQVKCRHEKELARDHLAEGFDYYLPLVRRIRIHGDRKRRVLVVPLFDGYFFSAGPTGNGDERLFEFLNDHPSVLTTDRIVNDRRFVRECSSLEIALFANPELEMSDVQSVGQWVRVTGGPFEGIEGEVEEFQKSKGMVRVIVRVEMLGKGTSLDIDKADLEAISGPSH